jgi:uncharacterized protein
MHRSKLDYFVLLIVCFVGDIAMAQSTAELESRNKRVIEASFDAWRSGTGGPYDLLADDVTWTIVGRSLASRAYPSREAFMSEVIRPFNARMIGGLKPAIRKIYADGSTVIVFFDASGKAKDGTTYQNTYAWFLEMEDNMIIKAFAFFDSLEFNEYWVRVSP